MRTVVDVKNKMAKNRGKWHKAYAKLRLASRQLEKLDGEFRRLTTQLKKSRRAERDHKARYSTGDNGRVLGTAEIEAALDYGKTAEQHLS